MKQLLILLVCNLSILLLTGCQEQSVQPLSTDAKSHVEVFIEGGGEFPEFLVGKWKEERTGWEFVFESDGRLSSAVIPLAIVRVEPGKKTVIPMKKGGTGVYEPGEWLAQYSPSSRELLVKIVIERYRLEMGDDVLSGNLKDVIAGQVSEDGNYWQAEWFSYPVYIVNAGELKNHQLEEGPDEAFKGNLIFTKAEESND